MQFFSNPFALRSQLESQFDFMQQFSLKTIDVMRELSEMNLKLARQTVEGTLHVGREMMSCTDPMQLTQVAMKQLLPANERMRAYQQHLMGMLAMAQGGLVRNAETRMPAALRSADAATEEMVRRRAAANGYTQAAPASYPDTDKPNIH